MGRGRERVAVMARSPEPGRVKTRLIPEYGAEGAAALGRAFLEDLVERLLGAGRWEVTLHLNGERPADMLDDPRLEVRTQQGADLGERMLHVFREASDAGAERTVILGSDSPDLPLERVEQAFRALSGADLALVPALDGGYALLAARRPPEAALRDVAWGSQRVLAQTLERLLESGLEAVVLDPWYDVDRAADVAFLQTHLEFLWHCRGEERAPRTRRLLGLLAGPQLS